MLNIQRIVADNYLWLITLTVSAGALFTVTKKYTTAKIFLKKKTAENKNLQAMLKEYESDQSAALEHLTASKDRFIKGLRIQHAKWREDTRAKNALQTEALKAAHDAELAALNEQLLAVRNLKWDNAAVLADMNIKHQHITAEQQAALEKKHQEAMQERLYQFESKRAQYANFFTLLNKFGLANALRTRHTIYPILDEFQRNYIRALDMGNKKSSNLAVTVVKKRLEKLALEAQMEMAKIREEMDVINLIASEACREKIDELSDLYFAYMEIIARVMKQFIPLLLAGKTEKIEGNDRELAAVEDAIEPVTVAFMSLVREELGEL